MNPMNLIKLKQEIASRTNANVIKETVGLVEYEGGLKIYQYTPSVVAFSYRDSPVRFIHQDSSLKRSFKEVCGFLILQNGIPVIDFVSEHKDTDIFELREENSALEEEVEELGSEIVGLESEIEDLKDQIDYLENELDNGLEDY